MRESFEQFVDIMIKANVTLLVRTFKSDPDAEDISEQGIKVNQIPIKKNDVPLQSQVKDWLELVN